MKSYDELKAEMEAIQQHVRKGIEEQNVHAQVQCRFWRFGFHKWQYGFHMSFRQLVSFLQTFWSLP